MAATRRRSSPRRNRAANTGGDTIPLALTPGQVTQVVEAVSAEAQDLLISGLKEPQQLISSPLLEDPKISKSLLLGLVVLISFPRDGSERGNKQIAQELGLAASTTHRYINTLLAAGLLEQNPTTRRYRRPQASDRDRGGRRRR
jgi:DNA-binding MarR family transcriptional regulator